jgi:hypothetical protein
MLTPTKLGENQAALATIAAREKQLETQEKELLNALAGIEAERRALADDRAAIEKAERVKTKILAGWTGPPLSNQMDDERVDNFLRTPSLANPLGQARARIGDKRYDILATLREAGPLLLSEIVARTGQDAGRIKEQFKRDIPVHVQRKTLTTDGRVQMKFQLTPVGFELLDRFEACRMSRGAPLPHRSRNDGTDSAVGAPAA